MLLTKADKLKKGPAASTVLKVRQALVGLNPTFSVQAFSSLKKTGIDEAHARLDTWFHLPTGDDPIVLRDDRPR